jgi:hypothetical protein
MEEVKNIHGIEPFDRSKNGEPRGQGGDTTTVGGPLMKPTVSKP